MSPTEPKSPGFSPGEAAAASDPASGRVPTRSLQGATSDRETASFIHHAEGDSDSAVTVIPPFGWSQSQATSPERSRSTSAREHISQSTSFVSRPASLKRRSFATEAAGEARAASPPITRTSSWGTSTSAEGARSGLFGRTRSWSASPSFEEAESPRTSTRRSRWGGSEGLSRTVSWQRGPGSGGAPSADGSSERSHAAAGPYRQNHRLLPG